MCLIVSLPATKRLKRKRKSFITWKILELSYAYRLVQGVTRYSPIRELRARLHVARYRVGVNRSNRKSKAIPEKPDYGWGGRGKIRIHKGIHVFLSKPRYAVGAIPVIVHPRDLVAAGSNSGGGRGAVFMKVRIRKADYEATVDRLMKAEGR